MRLAWIIACAALARAQYSANEGEIQTAGESVAPTPTTIADGTPTISAAVLFPSASSSWAHNGTAYMKYSLPVNVSPKSVSYVLSNDNSGLLTTGNSQIEELKPYFVFLKLLRSTAQPAGTGMYWIKWLPAYGDNPDNVKPGTGYKVGVAFRVGSSSEPLQFVWSAPFEIRADGGDTLPADVSAYPANATMSNWVPPNGPQATAKAGALQLAPSLVGIGAIVATVALL